MSGFQKRKSPNQQMSSHLLLSGDKGSSSLASNISFSVHKRARTYESCGSRSLGLSLTCKLTPSVFRTAVSLFSIKKQRFIFGVS